MTQVRGTFPQAYRCEERAATPAQEGGSMERIGEVGKRMGETGAQYRARLEREGQGDTAATSAPASEAAPSSETKPKRKSKAK